VAALIGEVRVAPPDPEALAVRTALAALPAGDRELLTLVAWEGLTPAEAADVVGIGDAAARKRLQRARERFREELTRQGVHARPAAVG
jgi:RNA polymerase sigma-70 factor, ECF subfamily